jgi:exopolysaccharide biosynthesis predicted pyruvyltransferase EpsI
MQDMQDKFMILEEQLKAECGRNSVYYVPNSGNWGDALIRYGTLKFFNDINFNYIEVTRDKIDRLFQLSGEGIVIYGGGGGWCKLWNHAPYDVTNLAQKFNVIVLPSTYEFNYSIPNTIFFCRDMLHSKQNMPSATFCHDMAFYIGKQFLLQGKGSGRGYFFRRDLESAKKIKIPSGNNDISLKGNHLSDVYPFFDEISRFAVIYTDRLHVAIAACLLEKEVHFYPGAYFKQWAVYMSSIKHYFDNVYFHDKFDL